MRTYYGLYGNTIYQLCNHDMLPKKVINNVEPTHMDVSATMDRRMHNVNIHISDFSANAVSNKEAVTKMKEKLTSDKTTEITKLSPVYRIYMSYVLYDNLCGCIVDEGVAVKEVAAKAVEFPLGLTSEDEYVGRVGLELTSSIERVYRSKTPYGVMRCNSFDFSLFIKRIYVAEVTMSAFTVQPVTEPTYRVSGCNCKKDFGGHQSIMRVSSASSLDMDSKIIYDTDESGLVFDPVSIKYEPSKIVINLTFQFNDVIMVGDNSSIIKILEDNVKTNEPGDDSSIVTPDPGKDTDSGTGSDSSVVNPGASESGDTTKNPGGTDEGSTETKDDNKENTNNPSNSKSTTDSSGE